MIKMIRHSAHSCNRQHFQGAISWQGIPPQVTVTASEQYVNVVKLKRRQVIGLSAIRTQEGLSTLKRQIKLLSKEFAKNANVMEKSL